MTGTGLGAILFGPAAVSILGLIVLLFQSILLAHRIAKYFAMTIEEVFIFEEEDV